MYVTATEVVPSDELLVHGVNTEDLPIQGSGWVSATTNYFPPETYDPETGNRYEWAVPREMTTEEKAAYYLQVLQEDNPDSE